MILIKKYLSLLNRLRATERLNFYYTLVDVAGADIAAIQALAPLWGRFQALFGIENELFHWPSRVEKTEHIVQADRKRNKGLLALKRLILAATYGPDDTRQTALKLADVTTSFRKISRMPLTEKTAHIGRLIEYLREPEREACVEALCLHPTIDRLAHANERFADLYASRGEEWYEKMKLGPARKIRPQVDRAFGRLTEMLEALYLAAPATGRDQAAQEEMEKIIRYVNTLIDQYRSVLARRRAPEMLREEEAWPA
jgi:hypothetical protein